MSNLYTPKIGDGLAIKVHSKHTIYEYMLGIVYECNDFYLRAYWYANVQEPIHTKYVWASRYEASRYESANDSSRNLAVMSSETYKKLRDNFLFLKETNA